MSRDGLPRTVKVGWRTYAITTSDKKAPDSSKELADYNGLSYHEEGIIWIRDTSPLSQRQETLLHELMHCSISAFGFQHILAQVSKHEDTDNEENYVTVMASGLTMVLRDNPEVVKYLFGHLLQPSPE